MSSPNTEHRVSKSWRRRRTLAEESIEVRRQRNRQAQIAFRQRRQAEADEQINYIKCLDQTIDEINRVFVGFLDDVLECQADPQINATLFRKIVDVSARVLSLTKAVSESDTRPPSLSAATTNDKSLDTVQTAQNTQPSTPLSAERPLGYSASNAVFTSPTSSYVSPLPSQVSPEYAGSCTASTARETSTVTFQYQPQGSSDIDRPAFRVFNSKDFILDIPRTVDAQKPIHALPPHQKDALLGLGSFCLRLLEHTILHGYLLLSHELSKSSDVAGWTQCSRPVGELMERFYWLLGPGKEYSYCMSGISSEITTSWSSETGSTSSAESVTFLAPRPDYLTAIEIVRLLQRLGAKMLDANTMQIRLDWRFIGGWDAPTSPTFAETVPSPASWSYIDFFGTHQVEQSCHIAKLDIPLFIKNLTRTSTCIGDGPGYARKELPNLISMSSLVI